MMPCKERARRRVLIGIGLHDMLIHELIRIMRIPSFVAMNRSCSSSWMNHTCFGVAHCIAIVRRFQTRTPLTRRVPATATRYDLAHSL